MEEFFIQRARAHVAQLRKAGLHDRADKLEAAIGRVRARFNLDGQ